MKEIEVSKRSSLINLCKSWKNIRGNEIENNLREMQEEKEFISEYVAVSLRCFTIFLKAWKGFLFLGKILLISDICILTIFYRTFDNLVTGLYIYRIKQKFFYKIAYYFYTSTAWSQFSSRCHWAKHDHSQNSFSSRAS